MCWELFILPGSCVDMSSLKISNYFVIVIIFLNGCEASGREIVTTKSGDVRGVKIKDYRTVHAYLGIPYAVPPVGELRFKVPSPITPWEGVYNASVLPPSCMQSFPDGNFEWLPTDRKNINEDCLYLNIWVPGGGETIKKKAVMVWIHGGAFNTGSTNMDIYDGKDLSERGDVIVVTINYRLGAFGFLYSGTEDAPGNVGVKDQVLALRWIKDNIEAFGGDPSLITAFGESAGSSSISAHLISPFTKGLFKRAILQSGSALSWPDVSVGIAMSSIIAKSLGCLDEDRNITERPSEVLRCMRNIDAIELAAIERKSLGSKMPTTILPLYGDDYLPVSPAEAYNSGNIHNVEILIGQATDEGSIFLGCLDRNLLTEDHPIITKEEGAKYIEEAYKSHKNPPAGVIIDYYLKNVSAEDSSLILKRTYDSIGDSSLYCSNVIVSEAFSTRGMKAYYYVFSHRRRVSPNKAWMGVPHFEDVPFVFGKHLTLKNSITLEDLRFSKEIMDIWTSFAKTGVPTYEALKGEWPVYSKKEPAAVQLNPDFPKIINPYKEECNFWRQY